MIQPPQTSEHLPYYSRYIALVQGQDLTVALRKQIDTSLPFLRSISEQRSLHRYAPGKWSIREVLGHLIDTERIFAYRALRFARNDATELSSFEQDDYVAAASFDSHPWADLLAEFELVRRGNVLLFGGFDNAAWLRRGVANKNEISVRALAYI